MSVRVLALRAIFLVAGVLAAAPVTADQRYSTWSDPVAKTTESAAATEQADRVQDMVDKLNTLVDEAEKARAADPRFLRDLRDLARGFHRPWRRLLVSEDFQDGDYTANPVWTVASGRFWIEQGWGMRSTVAAPVPPPETQQRKLTREEKAMAVFGAILGKAAGQGSDAGQGATPAAQKPPSAAVHTVAAITNAFAMDLEMSSWQGQGRLEFGPYQGQNRTSGYRLAYTPGAGLELLRVTSRGTAIIDAVPGPLTLEDKRPHAIEWTRHPDGTMKIALDGKQVIEVADRGFRDSFDGVVIVNHGGDFILRRLAVYGTQ
jgi:hypothetical protein